MKKQEALDKFDPLRNRDDVYDFIEKLYEENYLILTPEEHKKVNDAIVIADVHGMNPFSPKDDEKKKEAKR